MKLTKIEVKIFRSFFDPAAISISEGMNALVGPNNSGKSNLIRALRMALDPNYEFNPFEDVPNQRLFAYPRTTLTFQCSGDTAKERTLLKYLDEYEKSVLAGNSNTSASKGIVRLVVTYRGNQQTITRQEYFAARGGGDRRETRN
ncbi:AAA family ATPase [Mycolicibacterium arenosum]|uniref:AAA family ATPase n=1 Tax=Mycolicibacterium arenosum TaxID=2952157 RepID=A0ABT1M4H2_9MYCO|nr:AAA family ATPase [Mycolicibacterium sp. CAU 1645]MCP9274051.1 AAA family ATPase [Mycolicibacterium sp. CAU 1645]